MSDHAKFSPSQLPRIIACPGSYKASLNAENTSSSYAEEGTMLHEVTALCLGDAQDWVSSERIRKYGLTPEQVDAIETCLAYVEELKKEYISFGYEQVVEEKVFLGGNTYYQGQHECINDVYGTVDYAMIIRPLNLVIVVDWKFGRGVEVSAISDQLKAYALAVISKYAGNTKGYSLPFALDMAIPVIGHKVITAVCQPRIKAQVDEHEWRYSDLHTWMWKTLVPALENAESDNPAFNPDEAGACRFCRAGVTCPARVTKRTQQLEASMIAFEQSSGLIDAVPITTLVELNEKYKELEAFFEAVQKHLMANLLHGLPVPGYKLVHGRSHRAWAIGDPLIVAAKLQGLGASQADCFEPLKLRSPAQVEKAVGKLVAKSDEFLSLVNKSQGKLTMVPESDKRPTAATVAEAFKALDELMGAEE